jgi:glycosyltransferase involved in cell wall biosynthesis
MSAVATTPSLSVVIPVYNEAEWIGRSVGDLHAALRNSPWAGEAEIVIVDDGSDEATKRALAELASEARTRVLTQENRGRFAARQAGIEAARGDLVMLLDSRVSISPDALKFVASRLDDDRLPVWNGHVEIDVERNPFARFWRTVTYAAWRDYLAEPRTTSFGLAEYDRYPKGTTCFVAPRGALIAALDRFDSRYADTRFANDDTVLIRSIAADQRINISPGFSCRYHSRDSLERFLRHSFHRGIVFFDGFARRGTRFFPVVVAFFPSSAGFAVLTFKRPRVALALAATVPLAAAAYAASLHRPGRDVIAFSLLAGPFAAAYSAGIWRGALLAAQARLRG